MPSKQRQANYLHAMGIPLWRLRKKPATGQQPPVQPTQQPTAQLQVKGSGQSGWLWLLPGQPDEPQLLVKIKQAVEGGLEGAELCISDQTGELNVRRLIDEYLITRVVAFGKALTQQLERDQSAYPWPESVAFIKAPGLKELEQSMDLKRQFWQQLKQHKELTQ